MRSRGKHLCFDRTESERYGIIPLFQLRLSKKLIAASCINSFARLTSTTVPASQTAYENGREQTGLALKALEDAILNGSFQKKKREPRFPKNAQKIRPEDVQEMEDSESAEEIRRNAEKIYLSSSEDVDLLSTSGQEL